MTVIAGRSTSRRTGPLRPRTARAACALALVLLAAPAQAGEPRRAPVVAIDAGHGGTNLGAPGLAPGLFEKTVTLALAKRVRELLGTPMPGDGAPAPGITVVLCRESDTLVPIRARSRCAAETGAQVFVSLHANAVPSGVAPGSRRGFEVFVLGPGEVDDDAAVASVTNRDPAEAAWAAHEVRAAAEQSVALARVMAERLATVSEPTVRYGVRQSGAALDVLRGAGTAAVLVEVGFMDHPEEGARLGDPAGREPLARALSEAIRAYLAGATAVRTPAATAQAGARPPAPLRPLRAARP